MSREREIGMSQARVHNFTVSLDGFGTSGVTHLTFTRR
jgi:hypothetical protein